MRIARFSLNDKPRYAFVQQDPADGKDYLIELDGYPFGAAPVKPTGERYALDADGLRLLAPVIPSKVYGLAKNYEAHAQFMHESGHSEIAHAPEDMVIFSKPSTSVIGPDDPIVIPSYSNDMNFEPEVAVIMGRIAKNVPVEKAMDYVLGFTCVNDVTLRDLQGLDPMWTRAKGFDTSCPLGPWIQTELDWKDAKIHVLTHGLHYASAVFEGERAYGGRIFKLTEHNQRLHASAGRETRAGQPQFLNDFLKFPLDILMYLYYNKDNKRIKKGNDDK